MKKVLSIALLAACLVAQAAQQPVNIGTGPNTNNGDPLRTAFTKLNANDAELYAKFPTCVASQLVYIAAGGAFTCDGNLVYSSTNHTLSVTGVPASSGLQPEFVAVGDATSAPIYEWLDASSSANNKRWWALASGVLGIYAVADDGTPGQSGLQINRSGSNITQSTLLAGSRNLGVKNTGDMFVNSSLGQNGNSIISAGIGSPAAWGPIDLSNANAVTNSLPIGGGGTGAATFTAHGLLVGEGTSPFSSVAAMGADTLLAGQGTGADPASISLLNCGDATHALSYSTSTHTFGCQSISGSGISTPVSVPNGGTGLATLTSHSLMLGEGTSNVAFVSPLAADTLLQGQGTSSDPAAVSLLNCGDSTHALSYSTSTHTFGCQAINALSTPVTVPNGGTGLSTLTAHGLVVGAGTSSVNLVAAMAADTLLQGQGATVDPAAVSLVNCIDPNHALAYSTTTHAFSCQPLNTLSTPVSVPNGGTGQSALTVHGVLVGENVSGVASVAAMAADTLLAGQGTSSDPAAVSLLNCGDSTHALSYSTSTHTFGCQSIAGLSTPVTVPNGGTGLATITNHGVMLGQGTSNVATVAAMSADTFLQGQGSSSDPAAGSLPNCGDSSHALAYSTSSHQFTCQNVTGTGTTQFTIAAKTGDTSRASTTTLTDDPELQVTSLVAGTYSVEWMVIITGPAGNVNFKAGLDCSATVTSAFWATNIIDAAGNRGSNAGQNACPASQTQTVLTSGAYTIIQGFGTVVQSTTGTIAIQWTQAASSGTAEVAKAGSWLRVSKIL